MGNQQQTNYSVLTMPSPGKWKQFAKADHCLVIKNQETGEEAEVYTVGMMDGSMMQEELEMYEYRRSNDTKLVKVLNVSKAGARGLCSGTDSYRVVTERIPMRLGQVDNLQLAEALHVLKECLDGFELIYPSIERPIEITKDMIGFTPQGKVKVWVNTNFAVNLPDRESYLKSEAYHSDESEMPKRLFFLIEEQLAAREFPQELKERIAIEENNTLSFARMKTIIRNYSIDNDIPFLERLNLYEEGEEEGEGREGERVTIIQETRIQSQPPLQVQQAIRNNSIINQRNGNVNGAQQSVYIVEDQQERIKDRAIPNTSFKPPMSYTTAPPQMIPSQLAYQVNFPINRPQAQEPINSIPTNLLNFQAVPNQVVRNDWSPSKFQGYVVKNPVRNFEEAITYEQRPSIHGQRFVHNNYSQSFSPPKNPLPLPTHSNQPIPSTFNLAPSTFSHNNPVPPPPRFDKIYTNNLPRLNPEQQPYQSYKFQHQPLPFLDQYQPTYNTNSIPYHSSRNIILQNHQNKFLTPNPNPRIVSPARNQMYVNHIPESPSSSLASFRMNNNTPTKFQLTPNPKSFEFSTGTKQHEFSTFQSPYLNRPLFRENQNEFTPPPSSKTSSDNLLKRMEELTMNVKNTINQAQSGDTNESPLPPSPGKMDIRNYGKDRIRSFN